MKNFISGVDVADSISEPIKIFYDSATLMFYSKNNKSLSSSKHIEIKYVVIRDKIKEGQIVIQQLI